MAEATKAVESKGGKGQDAGLAAKYGGHDAPKGPAVEAPEQPNPSDPANTGTTPGSVAEVG